ncbi:hypothetical protein ES332_A03G088700v1 [Gossypium tomentosum]|uniref:Uncharacterized protein n=1 Tax=Gossypium tomentosum TaxID=34277 RepID=A0A5D2R4K9_GOSTO|nr:hypothetical protein ES332_A03G088700v1 [Gossypium tomentosum]
MLKAFYTSCMLMFSKSWLVGAYAGQGVLFILESRFRELTVILATNRDISFRGYERSIPVDLLDRMVIIRT